MIFGLYIISTYYSYVCTN